MKRNNHFMQNIGILRNLMKIHQLLLNFGGMENKMEINNHFMQKIKGIKGIKQQYASCYLTLEGELTCIKNKNNEVIRAKYPIFLVNLVNIPNTQLNFGGGI